jgi:ribulose 1,5-bisphosphate synthetase/thiazole synthase
MLDLSSPVRLDPSLVSSSRHQCLGVVTVTKAVRRRGPPSRCRPLLITAAKLVGATGHRRQAGHDRHHRCCSLLVDVLHMSKWPCSTTS